MNKFRNILTVFIIATSFQLFGQIIKPTQYILTISKFKVNFKISLLKIIETVNSIKNNRI